MKELNDYQEMLLFEYLMYKEIGNSRSNDDKYNEVKEYENNHEIVREVVLKYKDQYPPLLIIYAENDIKENPEIFNWGLYSPAVARIKPHLLDTLHEHYNWKLYAWAVEKYCPEYMKYHPKNKQHEKQ